MRILILLIVCWLGEPDLGGMDFSVSNVFIWFSSKSYPNYIILYPHYFFMQKFGGMGADGMGGMDFSVRNMFSWFTVLLLMWYYMFWLIMNGAEIWWWCYGWYWWEWWWRYVCANLWLTFFVYASYLAIHNKACSIYCAIR